MTMTETGGGAAAPETPARPHLELLKRRRGSMIRKHERRGMLLEMRAKPDGTGGTEFVFEGYGATFDQPFEMWDAWGDPYTEVVRQGAFARSLARPDLDVPFLIGHNDAGIPLARTRNGTMQLSQDSHGLNVRATMDGGRSDVRNLASAVERGDLDEMSIGFVTLGQEWSPDWETRAMTDLDLHRGDVSAVALAANPSTAGSTMIALSSGKPRERRGGDELTPVPSVPGETSDDGRPLEELARGEVKDSDTHPDFNVPGPDNGAAAVQCPYVAKNGCGQTCPGGSKFCGNCGGPLYNSDGLIVADDNGVVEEVGGSMADADLLSRRLRLLELA